MIGGMLDDRIVTTLASIGVALHLATPLLGWSIAPLAEACGGRSPGAPALSWTGYGLGLSWLAGRLADLRRRGSVPARVHGDVRAGSSVVTPAPRPTRRSDTIRRLCYGNGTSWP